MAEMRRRGDGETGRRGDGETGETGAYACTRCACSVSIDLRAAREAKGDRRGSASGGKTGGESRCACTWVDGGLSMVDNKGGGTDVGAS